MLLMSKMNLKIIHFVINEFQCVNTFSLFDPQLVMVGGNFFFARGGDNKFCALRAQSINHPPPPKIS